MLARQVIGNASDDGVRVAGKRVIAEPQWEDFDIRSKLAAMGNCKTSAELRGWLLQFARGLGFYGARYVHVGTRWWCLEQTEVPLRFLTTSDRPDDEDKDWLSRDPCVARVQKAFAPFAWSTRVDNGLTAMQRLWLERERARGVAAGIAVPVQDSADGPAYLSLFGYDEAAASDMIDQYAPELAFVAAQFHAMAKRAMKPADWAPTLSKREVEVLRLAALGKTYDESAEALGVSHRTVEYHLRKASEKLGAVTKIRAVVIAFGMGLAEI